MIHPTAHIEENVKIGSGTAVWDHVHVRRNSQVGCDCIIGGKSYLAYGVQIGNRVKINSMVYICHGVHIEDGVMISAGTVFTNDLFPRAATPDLAQLLPSAPGDELRQTHVREGATIGANCTIGSDLEIGRFAMVGMGAVVTRSVSAFHLSVGNPSRSIGCVCRCGQPLCRFDETTSLLHLACQRCRRHYDVDEQQQVTEVAGESPA